MTNPADRIYAFAKAEQIKKNKKRLLSVEAACKAKTPPEGVAAVKKPKPAILKTKPETFAPLVNGFSHPYWVVYFFSTGPLFSVLGPVEAYNRYHDSRADARRQAKAFNDDAKAKGLYRKDAKFLVARVTVSVKYTP